MKLGFIPQALPIRGTVANASPFPGRYPTRVEIRMTRGVNGAKPYTYLGKPNITVMQTFIKLLIGRRYRQVRFIEFDRQNKLRSVTNPYVSAFTHDPMHYDLLHRYYPWTAPERLDGNTKFYPKTLRLNGKRVTVYSPEARLSIRKHIEPFKTWLRAQEGANG